MVHVHRETAAHRSRGALVASLILTGGFLVVEPVPSIKLATNSLMYRHMEEDMDVNCGVILEGTPLPVVGRQIFEEIVAVASMSETMTPEQVVEFLNDYFSEMVDAVFEHGGVLDKFMGDALLCVFGSFEETPDHPRRAVMSALRMKALLAKINGERTVAGRAPIEIGIGVHTDDVIVGNIGSRRRLEYTVIGDGVNTCQRVQDANKEFGTTILITETTYEAVRGEFECRPMPEVALKGKTKVPRFFEVLSAQVQ